MICLSIIQSFYVSSHMFVSPRKINILTGNGVKGLVLNVTSIGGLTSPSGYILDVRISMDPSWTDPIMGFKPRFSSLL